MVAVDVMVVVTVVVVMLVVTEFVTMVNDESNCGVDSAEGVGGDSEGGGNNTSKA